MKPAIVAIGTANPIYKQHQKNAAELISILLNLSPVEKRLLKSVYRSTGIEYRYSVLNDFCKMPGQFEFFPNEPNVPFPTTATRMQIYKKNALKLALAAVEDCLSNVENFDKHQITHLIAISCTGMYAPGIDIEIVQELHLNPSVKRTSINFMGCYAAFNGLKVAEAICKADPDASVLIVCVELCTLHFQNKTNLNNIISNAIFADGAACVLVQGHSKQKKYFSLETFHCDLLPQTSKEMAWDIADSGFDIVLTSYVPEVIKSGIATFMQQLIQQAKLKFESIDFYAIHPGGLKILQACEEALNISKEQNQYSYDVLRNYGNMSSPTVLFVLKNIWNEASQANYHNKNIFSCAFGPGLTFESMLLKIQNI